MPDPRSPRVTMAEDDLAAELFGGGTDRNPPQPGWKCAKAELIAAYLDGVLDDTARLRLEAHQSNCEHCRSMVGDVIKIQRESLGPAPPAALVQKAIELVPDHEQRFRWMFAPMAAAAVIACTIIAVLLFRTPERLSVPMGSAPTAPIIAKAEPLPKVSTNERVRKSPSPKLSPSVIFPLADSVLSSRGVDFRWKTVSNARYYQVQVVTYEGEPAWEGRSTSADLRLPTDLVLKDGKYFVWISAMMDNGRVEKSDPVGFRIASSR